LASGLRVSTRGPPDDEFAAGVSDSASSIWERRPWLADLGRRETGAELRHLGEEIMQ